MPKRVLSPEHLEKLRAAKKSGGVRKGRDKNFKLIINVKAWVEKDTFNLILVMTRKRDITRGKKGKGDCVTGHVGYYGSLPGVAKAAEEHGVSKDDCYSFLKKYSDVKVTYKNGKLIVKGI